MDTSLFHRTGHTLVPGLLAPDEVAALLAEFMALPAGGRVPGHFEPRPQDPSRPYDPLGDYPRVMNPHEINDPARRMLLDERLGSIVTELLGEEPIAAQSMFYFKPPGARGQALHQDNFYLRVEPGTCVAAWIALDRVDRANGGLEVVPGTHRMDLFCPEEADPGTYFTKEYVPPPPGLERVPVDMNPGDVLFFNGSLVHGSEPNSTTDRFRRSFICHYAPRSTVSISRYYRPLSLAGEDLSLAESVGGGPCGTENAVGAVH
ncbi:phytanoyl-CoA dioxygenase family protein [Streptomyces sp. NA04227]|uniref:phytanoyl-CoA dioxygenase family protein n=1 Tax=Streptomyces sp. NA04227 TaxID=2742136 RepID=UPI001590F1C3|nr:phytanoyl-CoA dioxygenase family protein [Streptomyces sp. NA04227]QKW09777.1 phytanoyl-CoA dioxygenase family protein [Streptomyces sp. NA04227]